jgi:hydrogenase/urease accessory protein HupE
VKTLRLSFAKEGLIVRLVIGFGALIGMMKRMSIELKMMLYGKWEGL